MKLPRIFQHARLLVAGASAYSMSTLFSAMKPILLTRFVEQAEFTQSFAGLAVAMPFVGIALAAVATPLLVSGFAWAAISAGAIVDHWNLSMLGTATAIGMSICLALLIPSRASPLSYGY